LIKKQYSATEYEFAFQWADKWFQLVTLILELIGTDEPPWSPPPPSELDELNYQSLRFWFIDHEEQFKPLWRDFYECKERALREGNDEVTDVPDTDEYVEDPFSYCYQPENLYRLVRELDIQSGIDLWEPSRHRAWTAAVELTQMCKIVVEFFNWIDGRT
jgi:hypothetical protein